MQEVTPDLIAEIATRLYNQLPQEGAVPQPEAGLPSLPQVPAEVPAAFPAAPAPASSLPAAPPGGFEGLRAFVQRIQAPHSDLGAGLCGEEPGRSFLQRVAAPQSAPAPYGSRALDVPTIRRDFPVLQQRVHGRPIAWLDNAATTQKPQSVIDAVANYYARDNSNIHRAAHTLAARSTDAFEQARQKVQTFLGASSTKEIVLVRGTTEGINLVAQAWGRKFLQPGDEIVLSTLEHHANIVPWQMVAREKGAVLRIIPVTDRGEIMLEEYQALLGPRTKLVSLAHASNSLGTILP
ncbi:MAG TPA: aminotransferase class V-fold PLP-dependent enzyme, partial [Planctomycetaceae bacterium]|nr:aminotransferase class V-fold PLP-dependent enzyme [Planctomycetaceae bacterium]